MIRDFRVKYTLLFIMLQRVEHPFNKRKYKGIYIKLSSNNNIINITNKINNYNIIDKSNKLNILNK